MKILDLSFEINGVIIKFRVFNNIESLIKLSKSFDIYL